MISFQDPANLITNLPRIITAIGGLGTAAFGLVDATKTLPGGGANRIGFSSILSLISRLTPDAPADGLSQSNIIATLKANWFNGTDLASQKAIAKSLIKVNLNPANAAKLAALTGVDSAKLTIVAQKINAGTVYASTTQPDTTQPATTQTGTAQPGTGATGATQPVKSLLPEENDAYARFDFVITALLDATYQFADQRYTNGTRIIAAVFAVALAIFGGLAAHVNIGLSILAGLLATPLAPVAKDVTSALAAAVNTMQTVKKA